MDKDIEMKKFYYRHIILLLVISSTVYASVYSLSNKFSESTFDLFALISFGILMAGSYYFIEIFEMKLVYKLGAWLGAMAMVCWMFSKIVFNAVRMFINGYSVAFDRYYQSGVVYFDAAKVSVFVGLGYMAVLLCGLLMFLNKFIKRDEIYLVFPLATTVLYLLVGYSPSLNFFMVVACSFICVKIKIWDLNIRAAIKTALIVVIFFVITLFAGTFFANAMMGKATSMKDIQSQIEKTVLTGFHYEFSSDKNKVDNDKPEYDNTVVMAVSTKEYMPYGTIYLKDFYADEYVDLEWKQNEDVFKNACKEKGVSTEDISGMLESGLYNTFLYNTNIRTIDYSIEYNNLYTDCAYVPYGVEPNSIKETLSGDFVTEKKVTKESIEFNAVSSNTSSKVFENIIWSEKYEQDANEKNSKWDWYTDFVKVYIHDNKEIDSLDKAVKEFTSYYGETISSASVDSNLEPYYKVSNRYNVATQLAEYFRENYRYNLNLDDIDSDPIDYFLEESHEGYCVHFASAATLILQKIGIPARYVSGYLVTSAAFDKTGDDIYTAKVKDSNAHAWVEIYFDKIGWVPFEFTPGYGGGDSEAAKKDNPQKAIQEKEEDSKKKQDNTEKKDEQKKEENKKDTESVSNSEMDKVVDDKANVEKADPITGEPVGEDKNNSKSEPFLNIIIFILAAIGVVVALILFISKKKEEIRRFFLRKVRSKSVLLKKHRHLYKTVRGKNISAPLNHKHIKDVELEKMLVEHYPQVSCKEWEQYMNIVRKAKFGLEDIEMEEYILCDKIFTSLFTKS